MSADGPNLEKEPRQLFSDIERKALMDILAPWSLSSYLPLNGFRPLYRSLARHCDRDLRIVTPRTPNFQELQKLAVSGFYKAGTFKLTPPNWAKAAGNGDLFSEFAEAYGTREMWLQSNLPGDVELHHTAPATRGDRPFLLHCEDFLSALFPFFKSNQNMDWDRRRVERVRIFYKNLFEDKNCLGIISHLPETLEQFSSFFQSDAIDKKLVGMPAGLDSVYIATSVEKSRETTKFVFVDSPNQTTNSFVLRGGVSCLKLALHLLKERDDCVFYFRARRPANETLVNYGIDPEQLKQHDVTKIIWIEQYLPENALSTLVAKCHFLLLPSADVHSVSIMLALANGTIPIVTDTIGTNFHIDDMSNGIIIRGVRSEICTKNDALRTIQKRSDRFHSIEGAVTTSLIKKLSSILGRPEKICEMSNIGRNTVSRNFIGTAFADRLIGEIKTRSARSCGYHTMSPKPRLADNERWIEDISSKHFRGPQQPLDRIRLDNGRIVQLRNDFFFVPSRSRNLAADNDFWSPVPPWSLENSQSRSIGQTVAIRSSSLNNSIHVSVGPYSNSVTLPERVYLALAPYRIPYLAARWAYRTFLRLGLRR